LEMLSTDDCKRLAVPSSSAPLYEALSYGLECHRDALARNKQRRK
jgi:hypothetical protein